MQILISLGLALLLNKYVTLQAIRGYSFFYMFYQHKFLLHTLLFLFQSSIIFIIIYLLSYRKVNKYAIYSFLFTYVLLLLFSLFVRAPMKNYQFTINVFDLFDYFRNDHKQAIFETTFNVLLLIPIGFLFKHKSLIFTILISTGIFLIIEFLQLMSRRGFFDITDIMLNLIGILIGYFISKKISIQLS